MTRAVDLHSKRLARVHQLTGPQLVCLRQIQREVTTTPTALAEAVSLSQGTVSGILDRLEARALLKRERSGQDKRKFLVRLTDAGRELIATAPSPLHEQFSTRLSALPEGEQAMIDWVLSRVVALMEAEGVDAAPMFTTGPVSAEANDIAEFLDPHEPEGDD
jgi:DNA-binding MarR family transcriptional regulator